MRKTGSVMLLDCNDARAGAANVATCVQVHAEFFPTLASCVQSLAQLRRSTTLTHCRPTRESVADARSCRRFLVAGCTRCGISGTGASPPFWIAVATIEFQRQASDGGEKTDWRRGRDSNPRYGCPYAAFRVRCIQPLCHLSAGPRMDRGSRVYLVHDPAKGKPVFRTLDDPLKCRPKPGRWR